MTERLLPRAEVQLRTGLSKSTIYARIAAGWVQTAPGCWRRGEHGSYKFGDGARIEF